MSELSFDDIQYDRKQFILEKTRISRRNWIMSSKPPFHEFIRKFPPFKDLGFDVSSFVFYICNVYPNVLDYCYWSITRVKLIFCLRNI